MGDRGNIKVGKIYLYTHWSGSGIKNILKKALSRKQRWDDEAYFTRIIFCEMLIGSDEELNGETGFGISTTICDNEHNILEVDCKNQKVKELEDESDVVVNEWTFEEFISQEFEEDNEGV